MHAPGCDTAPRRLRRAPLHGALPTLPINTECCAYLGHLDEFATQYTAAWCSHKAAVVASFFAPDGSLKINQGNASVGRPAITVAVQKFMTAFPDLIVKMDKLTGDSSRAAYYWTLTGTNTGPGGTGHTVRISGYEEWQFGAGHHIAESRGHFDEADYQRQLNMGAGGST